MSIGGMAGMICFFFTLKCIYKYAISFSSFSPFHRTLVRVRGDIYAMVAFCANTTFFISTKSSFNKWFI